MAVRIVVLFALSVLTAPLPCFGQEAEEFPDSALAREQWQQRIQDSRRRSEEFVANARERPDTPTPPGQAETEPRAVP
jgi:hypothetical protein